MEKVYDMNNNQIKDGDCLRITPGSIVSKPFYVAVKKHKYNKKETGHTTGLDSFIPHLHGAWLHNRWTNKRALIIGKYKDNKNLVDDPKNGTAWK